MLRIQITDNNGENNDFRNCNCDRLIYVLSHYKQECNEMIIQCENIQLYKDFNSFLTESCKTYFKMFPSTALCKSIEYGSTLWCILVLNIMNIILNVTDSPQLKQISNILILSSYLSPIKHTNKNKSIAKSIIKHSIKKEDLLKNN